MLSQPKPQRYNEPKLKLEKLEFVVVTIVYSEKLRENRKDQTRSAKTEFWVRESIMHREGVNTLQHSS